MKIKTIRRLDCDTTLGNVLTLDYNWEKESYKKFPIEYEED